MPSLNAISRVRVAATSSTGIIWKDSSSRAGIAGKRREAGAIKPACSSGHDHCRASAAVTCCSLVKPSSCSQRPIFFLCGGKASSTQPSASLCAANAQRNCSAVICCRDKSSSPSGMRLATGLRGGAGRIRKTSISAISRHSARQYCAPRKRTLRCLLQMRLSLLCGLKQPAYAQFGARLTQKSRPEEVNLRHAVFAFATMLGYCCAPALPSET